MRFVVLTGVLVKDPAFWRSLARGRAERSESMSMSLEDAEESEPADDLRRRFAGLNVCAQSGTGFRSSNCRRNRTAYSLPLTTSSFSFTRSFRSRGFPASDTINRSSSLSSHAGASLPSLSSKFVIGTSSLESTADGPASRKKSFAGCELKECVLRGVLLHPHRQRAPVQRLPPNPPCQPHHRHPTLLRSSCSYYNLAAP